MENLINPELEATFIGACLVDSQVLIDSILSVEDFGIVSHQRIYAAVATVYEDCGQTDPVLVADYLNKVGELNRVGGHNAIYEIQQAIVETVSAEFYAREILRLSIKRKLSALIAESLEQTRDLESDPEHVVAALELNLETLQFEQQQLEYYTALELSKMEIEPVKWFIPGFLPSGLTILAGPPKIGKSFFCWNMALAVATGGIAFSSVIIPEIHNVSYLSFEDPPELLKDRLTLMSDEMPNNLHIVSDMQGHTFDPVGLKMLDTHLDETKSELIVVDTWKHVTPDISVKGTSYDIDYAALIPVQRFAHRRNIGIVLVTHTRKATDMDNAFNQIQGSVGMQAGCDTMMMLSHDSGSKTLHLSGRRIPNDQFAFTVEEGIWILEGNAQDYHGSELRREIIAHLKEAGNMGLSAGDLIDLTGKKDSNVRQTLRRMVKDNELDQPKKRGDYFLKDDGNDEINL